ncbi:MAG: methyltransferase [Bdellovibrionota bacterium]
MNPERIETLPEKRFTQSYSQPEAYRFCQDSILAPLVIARDLEGTGFARVLDLGAGCGVMGLELVHALPSIRSIDFLEIQPEFRPYFEANLATAGRSKEDFRFMESHWSSLHDEPLCGIYDVVVSNPPYFAANEGTLGPIELSNRCRFFLDDSFEGYVRAVRAALKPGARAYLLVKNGERHGRNTLALLRTLVWDCEVETLADIRGTDLVKIPAAG